MRQDAVLRNLEIVGEAAGKLSDDLRDRSPTPWKKVIALRNRLIHAYWGVDLILVRDVVVKDLAPLEAEVCRLLSSIE